MPRRKRPAQKSPSSSDGDGDGDEAPTVLEVDKLVPPKMNAATICIMQSIASLRASFADESEKKQQAYAEKLTDLMEKLTQRFEEEQNQQETRTRDLLLRLDLEIEKKAFFEKRMVQVVASVRQEAETFQHAISSLYAERIEHCKEGVEMTDQAQQGGGMPLMQGEQTVRARMEKLME
ncbi:uncharacterized protein PG986_013666 [Apiospora aurea]|uniref:Uncharacterized protein n=1 Tax=Apiospora aurea TaxID=335848 RepID=A0ABR1PW83_9PEZI